MRTQPSFRSIWLAALVFALGCGSVTNGAQDAGPDAVGPFTQRRAVLRASANQPGPLFSPKLVYDDARRSVILYGGISGLAGSATPTAAMWELTASGWQSLCNPCTPGPGPRSAHAMAYDPVRDRIVLYGGDDGNAALSSVFEWNGSWTPVAQTGASTPGARRYSSLVYDRVHARMLLVGGEPNGMAAVADVWSYSAGAWAPLASGSTSPTEVAGSGMIATFDPARGVLALRDNHGANHDELWAWNDGWTQVCQSCSTRPRIAASVIYDPTLATTYLLSGFDAQLGAEIDGTWKLAASAFVSATVEPRGRDSEGVAYDAARDVIVVYGGNGPACPPDPFNCSETWELVPDR